MPMTPPPLTLPAALAPHPVDLGGEPAAGVHDHRPGALAGADAGDVQPIRPALLHVHQQAVGGHVAVVALLHGLELVVHRDPLLHGGAWGGDRQGWQEQQGGRNGGEAHSMPVSRVQ
jgi:hypothetical protein